MPARIRKWCHHGSTGTGKSKLAAHLATRFSGEIINSVKMQVYKGLPCCPTRCPRTSGGGYATTSRTKRTRAWLHSLIDPRPWQFPDHRRRLQLLHQSPSRRVRVAVPVPKYECCFLWLACPSRPASVVSERVDQMVEVGLVNEVRAILHPEADYSHGIRLSIGVPDGQLLSDRAAIGPVRTCKDDQRAHTTHQGQHHSADSLATREELPPPCNAGVRCPPPRRHRCGGMTRFRTEGSGGVGDGRRFSRRHCRTFLAWQRIRRKSDGRKDHAGASSGGRCHQYCKARLHRRWKLISVNIICIVYVRYMYSIC